MTKPTCASCDHSWSRINNGGRMCRRGLFTSDLVNGQQSVSRTCEFERAWLWSLFIDTCGPEGEYWTARIARMPPTGCSAVMRPTR